MHGMQAGRVFNFRAYQSYTDLESLCEHLKTLKKCVTTFL